MIYFLRIFIFDGQNVRTKTLQTIMSDLIFSLQFSLFLKIFFNYEDWNNFFFLILWLEAEWKVTEFEHRNFLMPKSTWEHGKDRLGRCISISITYRQRIWGHNFSTSMVWKKDPTDLRLIPLNYIWNSSNMIQHLKNFIREGYVWQYLNFTKMWFLVFILKKISKSMT